MLVSLITNRKFNEFAKSGTCFPHFHILSGGKPQIPRVIRGNIVTMLETKKKP